MRRRVKVNVLVHRKEQKPEHQTGTPATAPPRPPSANVNFLARKSSTFPKVANPEEPNGGYTKRRVHNTKHNFTQTDNHRHFEFLTSETADSGQYCTTTQT